jgi:hypothetical protein
MIAQAWTWLLVALLAIAVDWSIDNSDDWGSRLVLPSRK